MHIGPFDRLFRGAYAAVMLIPFLAFGQTGMGKESGTRLLERCSPALRMIQTGARETLTPEEVAEAQSCIGFLEGFIWGHGWAAWRERRDMYYCPPEPFDAGQALPTLVSYLQAHPDRLDAPAHVLVFAAFSDAYPCVEAPQHE